MILWKGPNCPETLLTCIINNHRSYWPILGHLVPTRGPNVSACQFCYVTHVNYVMLCFRPNGPFWDPSWVPNRTQGGTKLLIITYHTCEKCFRAISTRSRLKLARGLIYLSGGGPRSTKIILFVVKIF